MLGEIEQHRATGSYGFIVGIDFGTTFTGACYAPFYANGSSNVVPIEKWPKDTNYGYPKTPTILLYKKNGPDYVLEKWGKAAEKRYYKVSEDKLFFSLFKLLLDKDASVENKYSDQFPTKRLIADYLRNIDKHVKNVIRDQAPTSIYPDHCYCITVPAMWDDMAKSIMREAAIEAGMINAADEPGRLILTSEPEAAALECERASFDQIGAIQNNETIIICDAGGGTVDLTVYKVVIDGGKKYFEELTRGHGKSCGSSYIDDLARLWIRGHLDQCAEKYTESALDSMIEDFSAKHKPNVDGEDEDDINIELTGTIRLMEGSDQLDYIEGHSIAIPSEHMLKYIFDPVVNQVLELIDEQLNRIPGVRLDKLFLVGGFGQSQYLFKRLKEEFQDKDRIGIINAPPHGALAIAKGAVLYGLNPSIITHRVARRSYGVRCNKKFRDHIDDPVNLLLGQDGQRRCKNRLDFFVKKNTKIASSHFIEREYFAFYPQNTNSVLYSYNGDGVDEDLPDYVYSKGVEEVSRFHVRMPVIKGKKEGDKVAYKTRIYLGLTEIKFEVQIGDELQVHRVSLSEKPASAEPSSSSSDDDENNNKKQEEKILGYDAIIDYFQDQGFEVGNYTGKVQTAREIKPSTSRYLQNALTDNQPELPNQ